MLQVRHDRRNEEVTERRTATPPPPKGEAKIEMYASSFYAGLIGTELSAALACTDAELIVDARRERVHLVGIDEWREEVCPWCERAENLTGAG